MKLIKIVNNIDYLRHRSIERVQELFPECETLGEYYNHVSTILSYANQLLRENRKLDLKVSTPYLTDARSKALRLQIATQVEIVLVNNVFLLCPYGCLDFKHEYFDFEGTAESAGYRVDSKSQYTSEVIDPDTGNTWLLLYYNAQGCLTDIIKTNACTKTFNLFG